MLIINKLFGINTVLTTNKIGGIKSGKKFIEKLVSSNSEKLSKSQNLAKLKKSC